MAESTQTADQAAAASSFMAYLAAKGTPPRPDQITAPPDQKLIVYFDKDGKMQFEQNPAWDANAPRTTVYGSADSGYFMVNPDGTSRTVQEPNADALVGKAIVRQEAEAQRNERQANASAGKGYMTDAERIKIEQEGTRLGQNQQTINENKRQFDIKQQAQDRQDAIQEQKVKQDIAQSQAQVGLIGAQTGRTGAETEQIGAQTAVMQQKAGPEIAETQARTEQIKQQTEEARRKAGLPTIQTLGEGPTYAVMTPEGKVEERAREGYIPKTLPEVQARVGQMQQAIQAKSAELQGKISDTYSADQADADYRKWYDATIAPAQATLQSAQEQVFYDRAQKEAEARQAQYTAAQTMGQAAVSAYQAGAPYRVGAGAAEAMKQAASGDLSKVNWQDAAVYQGKDIEQLQKQTAAEALKYISPTAAAQAGAPAPTYQGANLEQALAANQWMPSAGRPPVLPPAAPGGAAPGGPTPEQLANRQAASMWTNQATLQGGGWGGMGPGAGIGNNAMANAYAANQAQLAAAAAPPPAPEPAPAAPMPAAMARYATPVRQAPAAAPAPAPEPWGPQASAAMNIGGWNTPEPWGPAASTAMNIGGWNTPAYSASPYQEGQDYMAGTSPVPTPAPPPAAPQLPRAPTGYLQPGNRYNAVTGEWMPEDPTNWQLHPELIPGNIASGVGNIASGIGNYLFPSGYG